MANQARITSTEALAAFRASIIVFLAKARRSLDDAGEDVRRTRQWLQHDQRAHWEGEQRRKTKQLEQAQQELMSVRLSSQQQSALMARQAAVTKIQRELAEIEGKLRKLKAWAQNYDTQAEPLAKRMDRLQGPLSELPKAIAYLANIQKTLEDYAESAPPATAPATAPSSEPEANEPA
jgi:chromosome segregation ATPase